MNDAEQADSAEIASVEVLDAKRVAVEYRHDLDSGGGPLAASGGRQHTLHAWAFGAFTLGGSRFEPDLQPKDYTTRAIGRISAAVDDLGTLDALA
jgi:hypothetical protein